MKNSSAKYVSCMKLNGFPILPPIITPEYRKELYLYQRQAVVVEKRLNEAGGNNKLVKLTSKEQTIAFNDDNEACEGFKLDLSVNRVPSNLTCDIQVSQYTNNQFKVIHCDLNSSVELVEDNNNVFIRRNSYTLDGPSPFLIDKLTETNNLSKCSIGSEQFKVEKCCSDEQLLIEDVEINKNRMKIENTCLFMDIEKEIVFVDNDLKKMNLSSDTETELMNLSFHSSIESQINPLDGLNHDLGRIMKVDSITDQNHDLYEILTKDYTNNDVNVGREHWAATVIVAWSRGHLVRRLLRSAHVQRLVDTIRVALICAVQLHSEIEDRIEAADVELHRRLIQQVSAACCDFHDVFFKVPTVEKLRIIRTDRITKRKQLENRSTERSLTDQGRVMALASRRQLRGGGGTTTRRLFPPFSTILQTT